LATEVELSKELIIFYFGWKFSLILIVRPGKLFDWGHCHLPHARGCRRQSTKESGSMRRAMLVLVSLTVLGVIFTSVESAWGSDKKPATKPAKTTTKTKTTTKKVVAPKTTTKSTTIKSTTPTTKTNNATTRTVTTTHRTRGVTPRWARNHHRFYHVYARAHARGARTFATHPQASHFAHTARRAGIPARVVKLNNAWQVRYGRSSHWHKVRATSDSAAAYATAQYYGGHGFQTRVSSHRVP
jgi:hypothetical protein